MALCNAPGTAAPREQLRRHEVDVERRRPHPGEPRRPLVTDRPPVRDDRRGSHGTARPCSV